MKTNKQFVEQMKLADEVAANAVTLYNQHLLGKSGKDLVVALCTLSTVLGIVLKNIPTLVSQEMAETLGDFTGGTIKSMASELAKERSYDTNKQAKSE